MRSDTRSRLTLVDRNGNEVSSQQGEDETAVEYLPEPSNQEISLSAGRSRTERVHQNQLLIFAAVSAGCAAAAVASGSYALWLSRRKIADEALTNVHDILKTCQDRVTRMEAELSQLPDLNSYPKNTVV